MGHQWGKLFKSWFNIESTTTLMHNHTPMASLGFLRLPVALNTSYYRLLLLISVFCYSMMLNHVLFVFNCR